MHIQQWYKPHFRVVSIHLWFSQSSLTIHDSIESAWRHSNGPTTEIFNLRLYHCQQTELLLYVEKNLWLGKYLSLLFLRESGSFSTGMCEYFFSFSISIREGDFFLCRRKLIGGGPLVYNYHKVNWLASTFEKERI